MTCFHVRFSFKIDSSMDWNENEKSYQLKEIQPSYGTMFY